MGKVVTSKGLNEFVQSGTVTHVPDHKPESTVKAETPPESPTPTPPVPPEPPKDPEPKGDDDEAVPQLSEDSRKYVNKQHRLRKEAEEAAAEADRLAESQYNRAIMAERRALELETQIAAKAPEKPKEPELVEPKEDDPQWMENGQFNWRKFTKDQAEYAAKTALRDFQKTQAEERSRAEQAEHETRIKASADSARQAHSDFDAVMEAAKGTAADLVPQFVLNFIYESDISAEIAYHLAKNPAETQRIAKLKPILGLAELGKLADKLTTPLASEKKPDAPAQPAVIERGGAPPPITPLMGGAGTVNTDPARMSFRELREFERSRNKRK